MKQKRLKIGWSSNVPWGYSGYATQTNLIVPRLKEAGFPIAVNGFAGFACGFINTVSEFEFKGRWEGIPFYPTLDHLYGSDGLWMNLQEQFQADVVIPFQDVFTLAPEDMQKIKRLIPYVPIDRTPVPPPVLQSLAHAWRIISYSQWGHDELLKQGYVSQMIPHGVDINIFKPMDKAEAKAMIQVPADAFVFGMVAANKENPPRKGFQHALDAFAKFEKTHPNAYMYFHSWVDQPGGFPIVQYANFLGLGHKIRYQDHRQMVYNQQPDMNKIMNSFDCLLAPSYSEGFGLPAIEAQSAGVPVIVNDFSAQTELVKDGITGFLAKPDIWRYDNQSAYHREVDLDSLYDAMEKVFVADRDKMGKEARRFMAQSYDIDKIVRQQWVPYLDKIENEIYGPLPPEPTALESAVETALAKTKDEFGEKFIIE